MQRAARVSNCGGNVLQSVFHADLICNLHASRRIRGVVIEFEIRLNAIEQRGSNRQESQTGVILGDGPDVPVHAKNLLHHHNRAKRGVSAFRNIRAQLLPIRSRKR